MSRRSNQQYNCHEIEQFAAQLLYAPPARRVEDIRRAERLHDELDPAHNYPFEFLAYRITDHRLTEPDGTTLVGEAVLPDLRLLIDSLSRSIRLAPSQVETEETTAELAARLAVSEKTIARWRRSGLRWRWVMPDEGGRKGVVFPASAVAHFLSHEDDKASKASAFSRMTSAQRRSVIEQAKALLMGEPLSLNQVATRIAAHTGRGLETIRELLQKHERDHMGAPMFGQHDAPLTGQQRSAIERAYDEGEPVADIAARFGRTRSTVYRAIHRRRAQRALRRAVVFVGSPTFDRDDADEVLLRPIAPPGARARRLDTKVISGLSTSVQPHFDRPLPPDRLMVALLLRYNYLKHLCAKAQRELRGTTARASVLDRFDSLLERAQHARSCCCHAALPLALSVCQRHLLAGSGSQKMPLSHLLLSAFGVLTDLVESHDAARSARFESVLTNRLLRAFAQSDGKANRDRDAAWRKLQHEIESLGPDEIAEPDDAQPGFDEV